MNLTKIQKNQVMIFLALTFFLMGIGVDLYVPSMPAIANYFRTSSGLVQLSVGLYAIAFGVGALLLVLVADSFGRKKVLLVSAALYALASFLPVFANNIFWLLLARTLQGFANAGLGTSCRSIATDCFKEKELVKAFTYAAIMWGLGPIVAPLIGAYLQYYFNWQANFVFFGCYSLMLLFYVIKFLPETSATLVGFKPNAIYQNIKTAVLTPMFLYGGIIISLVYVAMIVFNVIGPFLIQTTLKYSVVDYGHMALLLGSGYFLGGLCNRFLIARFRSDQIVFYAIVSGILISVLMLLLALFIKINLYIILLPVLFILIFCGLIFPNVQAKALSSVAHQGGTGNALIGVIMAIPSFLFSVFAKYLSTTTQISMACLFGVIFLICLMLYFKVQAGFQDEKQAS